MDTEELKINREAEEKKQARKEAYNDVKMYIANGWDLEEETPEFFLLKRNTQSTFVHLVLLCFFWWTFGLVNVLYYFMKKETKKILK